MDDVTTKPRINYCGGVNMSSPTDSCSNANISSQKISRDSDMTSPNSVEFPKPLTPKFLKPHISYEILMNDQQIKESKSQSNENNGINREAKNVKETPQAMKKKAKMKRDKI
jgi:hypothetical protein